MITWDELDVLLRSAQPVLAATLYPAAALLGVVHGAELHRLGDENIHTVDDYKPAPEPERVVRERRRLARPVSETPIHDRLAAEPMTPETAARIARVWLEDIGRVEQAKLGIRPRSTADRDLTGAFPVVAVA